VNMAISLRWCDSEIVVGSRSEQSSNSLDIFTRPSLRRKDLAFNPPSQVLLKINTAQGLPPSKIDWVLFFFRVVIKHPIIVFLYVQKRVAGTH